MVSRVGGAPAGDRRSAGRLAVAAPLPAPVARPRPGVDCGDLSVWHQPFGRRGAPVARLLRHVHAALGTASVVPCRLPGFLPGRATIFVDAVWGARPSAGPWAAGHRLGPGGRPAGRAARSGRRKPVPGTAGDSSVHRFRTLAGACDGGGPGRRRRGGGPDAQPGGRGAPGPVVGPLLRSIRILVSDPSITHRAGARRFVRRGARLGSAGLHTRGPHGLRLQRPGRGVGLGRRRGRPGAVCRVPQPGHDGGVPKPIHLQRPVGRGPFGRARAPSAHHSGRDTSRPSADGGDAAVPVLRWVLLNHEFHRGRLVDPRLRLSPFHPDSRAGARPSACRIAGGVGRDRVCPRVVGAGPRSRHDLPSGEPSVGVAGRRRPGPSRVVRGSSAQRILSSRGACSTRR